MKSISIVIPVFNKSELTERCLKSIFENSADAHEMIIIDNASTDDTARVLDGWKQKYIDKGWTFKAVANEKNVGFGRAMNQGARLASGEYLALVNNDTWILPGWDKSLIESMAAHPLVSLLCPHINEVKPFDESRILSDGEKFMAKNRSRVRKKFCAVFLFFRTSDFKKLDGFDERYFVTYEDTDLKERMDREGYKYLTVGNCFVWHQSMATRSSSQKHLPSNYEIQGKSLFMDKWGFDPSLREKTQSFRMKRRWERLLNKFGYL